MTTTIRSGASVVLTWRSTLAGEFVRPQRARLGNARLASAGVGETGDSRIKEVSGRRESYGAEYERQGHR